MDRLFKEALDTLADHAKAQAQHNEQRATWDDDTHRTTYSESHRREQQGKLDEAFSKVREANRQKFTATLSKLRTAYDEKMSVNAARVTDATITGALNVLSAMGNNVDRETAQELVEMFKGEPGPLKILAGALKNAGYKPSSPELLRQGVQANPLDIVQNAIPSGKDFDYLQGVSARAFTSKGSVAVLHDELRRSADLFGADVEAEPIPSDNSGAAFTKYGLM